MQFYLGTHHPNWLALTDVPLMVSNRRLACRERLPRARGAWVLDSGGFSELDKFDGWQTTAKQYVALVRRYADEIGHLVWAAQQDWMVEPQMRAKTGLSVRAHQAISLANYLELMDRAPDLPWLPVLQGWTPADYFRHVDMFAAAGVDLSVSPLVGLGSVCRRQSFVEARYVTRELNQRGLRLHGFGVSLAGLSGLSAWLSTSDSLGWSQDARRESARRRRFGQARIECPDGRAHKTCANCLPYALKWRERVLAKLNRAAPLFEGAA